MSVTTQSRYLMEHSDEGARIEAKTDIDATMIMLRQAGIKRGMRCLDVGCASGSTTRAMAGMTQPNLVCGLDSSLDRIQESRQRALAGGYGQPANNENPRGFGVQYVYSDAAKMPFEDDEFDFAWSRFLFEYLAEPMVVLREMLRVTRPGGRVVVADLDGNCIFHHPLPPPLKKGMDAVIQGAQTVGFDPWVGRKLHGYFCEAGLENVSVSVHPYHVFAGQIPHADRANWAGKLTMLRPVGEKVLGSVEAYDNFEAGFTDFLNDSNTFTYSTLMIASGTKAQR